jgi:tetratricopeptide (TPR) repeat protein
MSASVSGRISNRSRRLVVQMLIAALAFALAMAMSARAARAADPNDAKSRYLSGQSHYNLNEFAEALQDFKEAYRLRPDPAFLFNIAQCERQLGNLEEAIKFYRTYLRNKPEAGNKREIEKKIDELKGLIEAKKKATMGAPQAVIPPSAVDDQSGPGGASARAPEPTPAVVVPASPTNEPPPAAPEAAKATTSTSASTPTSANASAGTTLAAAEPSPATPGVDLTAHPSETDAGATPIYKRWYFWAGAGAVVVVLGVVAAVAMSGGSSAPPASGLGTQRVF